MDQEIRADHATSVRGGSDHRRAEPGDAGHDHQDGEDPDGDAASTDRGPETQSDPEREPEKTASFVVVHASSALVSFEMRSGDEWTRIRHHPSTTAAVCFTIRRAEERAPGSMVVFVPAE
jgi:hypothetical protein